MKIIGTNTPIYKIKNGERPILWGVPETTLQLKRNPFFIPKEEDSFVAEIHWVVKICRLGKNIAERFAHRYYCEATAGVVLCNNTIKEYHQKYNFPLYEAYAFDGAVNTGKFFKYDSQSKSDKLELTGEISNHTLPSINPADAHNIVDKVIHVVSQGCTIRQGDLILIKMYEHDFPISINTKVNIEMNGESILSFNIK